MIHAIVYIYKHQTEGKAAVSFAHIISLRCRIYYTILKLGKTKKKRVTINTKRHKGYYLFILICLLTNRFKPLHR